MQGCIIYLAYGEEDTNWSMFTLPPCNSCSQMIIPQVQVLCSSFAISLRPCSQYEACGLVQSTYSLLEDDSVQIEEVGSGSEGSGESSGQSVIYDDMGLPATPATDKTNATKDVFPLCSCANEAITCPLDAEVENDTRVVTLDPYLTLRFCQPVEEQFPRPCRGYRASWRVYGILEADSGTPYLDPAITPIMNNYTRTQIFCHCPKGLYKKILDIEAFGQEYAFGYICG